MRDQTIDIRQQGIFLGNTYIIPNYFARVKKIIIIIE